MSSLYHIENSLNLQDREPLFTSEPCEEAEGFATQFCAE
jgi:hypothetical protein